MLHHRGIPNDRNTKINISKSTKYKTLVLKLTNLPNKLGMDWDEDHNLIHALFCIFKSGD